jgi:Tol biopolymer transport system component
MKNRLKKKFLLFFCLLFSLLFLRNPLSYSDVSFGKNKVIVDQHRWDIAETEHFQIYHYPEERHLIPKVSKMLEKAYEKVTGDLNISIEKKTPFFLYMTHNHFEQNNIANTGEGVGGFSEPYKNRFVIPVTGSDKELEHVITHEFTHIAMFNIWYGGFWKSASIMRFVFYPLWIIEGLAEYESKEKWETYDHMLLRDVAISDMIIPLGKLHSFNHLKMHQISLAYQQGHSAISFLAEEYGEDKVPKLIKNLRESLEINGVFMRTIDTDLYSFDIKWQKYMKEKYTIEAEEKEEAETYGKKITENAEFNTNPVFSPDGKRIAFVSTRNGYGDLFVMNVDGTSQKSVLKSRIGRRVDVIHYDGHALSWSPDGEKIAFAGEKKQKDYLYIVNLRKNKLKKLRLPVEVLKSPCFSRKGDKIVFVGMEGGINNLYLVDTNGKNLRKLTSDEFDDNYPVFSPDDKKIVYVSEREKQKDLFLLDMETLATTQLTSTTSDEIDPSWSPDGDSIIYIGDYAGIYNIYRLDVSALGEDAQEEDLELDIFQLTDVKVGVFTPEISPDGKHLLFVSYRYGEMNIHRGEFPQEEVLVKELKEGEKRGEIPMTQLPPEPTEPIISPYPSPVTRIHPYRFKASTDLIFPFLFYSTTEGLYTAGYWQASDMLGNHGLITYVEYASEYDWLTYQLGYIYQRWRPALGFFAYGKMRRKSENDNDTVRTSEFAEEMVLSYPFDRFRRIDLGLITEDKREWNGDTTTTRENGVALSLVRDTTQGKILDIMSGSRANFTVYQAFKALGGDLDYTKYILDGRKYFKLSERNILGFRFLGKISQGRDREEFSLGGETRLRGLSKGVSSGSRLALINAEWRFMLFPEINWRFRLLWPEIYLKSLQLALFTDTGAAWDEPEEIRTISDIKNTIGIGLRINTFLIQMFPFTLRLDYGWRTDKFTGKFYFSLGPTF